MIFSLVTIFEGATYFDYTKTSVECCSSKAVLARVIMWGEVVLGDFPKQPFMVCTSSISHICDQAHINIM